MQRAYSQFLDSAVLQAQTQASYLDTYGAQISQIDNLLADPTCGPVAGAADVLLRRAGRRFQSVSVPSRQAHDQPGPGAGVALPGASSARLTEIRDRRQPQIADTVTQINTLPPESRPHQSTRSSSFADRRQPARQRSAGPARPARRRPQQAGARHVVKQSDGSINVFIGTGQSLVLGPRPTRFRRGLPPPTRQDYAISYLAGGTPSRSTPSTLQGGDRSAGCSPSAARRWIQRQNQLGRVATVLAQTFNDQHRLGQDLNGALGQDFFNVPAAQVVDQRTTTPAALSSARATANVGALTGSDYRLSSPPAPGPLTRLTDNNQSTFATFPQTVDGVTLTSPAARASSGDSFLIQPTRNGARDIAVALTRHGADRGRRADPHGARPRQHR